MKWTSIFLLLFTVALTGCPSTESENVTSKGIFAEYQVTETKDGVEVSATFWAGDRPGGTVIELSGNDEVSVNNRLLRVDKDGFGPTQYKAKMKRANQYTFQFYREVGTDAETYDAMTRMPEKVRITRPKTGRRFRRGSPLKVEWQDGREDNEITVNISGSGQSATGGGSTTYFRGASALFDNGQYVIQGQDTNPPSIRGDIYNVVIEVSRMRRDDLREFDDLNGTITVETRSEVSGLTLYQ